VNIPSESTAAPASSTVDLSSVTSELLGKTVESAERVRSGRNSRVFRLKADDSTQYVCKLYFGINRLRTEFSGLTFLWENGERAVPRPLVANEDVVYAIYEHIDGTPVERSAEQSDIEQAVAFLIRLRSYADRDGSDLLPPAAEACFSVEAIIGNIRARLSRLVEVQDEHQLLRSFLQDEFAPVFMEIESSLETGGLALNAELERQERTLSPSDFGFHNAIRRPDGEIAFVDFEYFGWDDPAKLISDFLLHPAMQLSDVLKRRFFEGTVAGFQEFGPVARRVKIVYPLFVLKWCMILLNEFLPEQLERREFAIEQLPHRGDSQSRQLKKAQQMLSKVNNEFRFPYST
jgi:hypothetical protein